MGGKVWSVEEERVFWTGWESLARIMQERMGQLARRQYTALMLYEHFFQNSVLLRFSPNAGRFVRAYNENERQSSGLTPVERSRSVQNPAWWTGGPSAGSSTGPRPNTLRLSEARAAATAASANQPSGQALEQQQHEDHHDTSLVGHTRVGQQSSSPTSSDKSTVGAAATPCAETDPTSGQATPNSSPAAVPAFTSLSNETSLGPINVQFSLPPLSETMALPLIVAPPIPRLPPHSLFGRALGLPYTALSNNHHQQQQAAMPRQALADQHPGWRTGHQNRYAVAEIGRNANRYPPRPENIANIGAIRDPLTTIRDLLMVMPTQLPSPSINQTPTANLEKPVVDSSKQTSAVEEIKQDEEASDLFVQQWSKA